MDHLVGDRLLGRVHRLLLVSPLLVEHLLPALAASAAVTPHARDPLVDVGSVCSLLRLREEFLLWGSPLVVDDEPFLHLRRVVLRNEKGES